VSLGVVLALEGPNRFLLGRVDALPSDDGVPYVRLPTLTPASDRTSLSSASSARDRLEPHGQVDRFVGTVIVVLA